MYAWFHYFGDFYTCQQPGDTSRYIFFSRRSALVRPSERVPFFSGVLRTHCLPDVSVDCSVDNSGVLLLYHDNLRRLAVILPEWLSATGGSTLVTVRHEQVGY